MRQAQLITYGAEGRLAEQLRELAQGQGLWLREVQHLRACRNLLRQGGPAVLVVVLGRDLVEELTLVQEIGLALPDTAIVVVGDTDYPGLAALAWDLGARCVLQPPSPVELLPEIVLRFLSAGVR